MRQGTVIAVKRAATSDKIIQYRLKQVTTCGGRITDVDAGSLAAIVERVPDAIDNLTVVNGELEFINGASKRYTDLNQLGNGVNPLVILNKIQLENSDKTVYEICDYKGETLLVDDELAAIYATRMGVANGKVVDKGTKKIISAIQGEYPSRSLSEDEKLSLLPTLKTGSRFIEQENKEREIQLASERLLQREKEEELELAKRMAERQRLANLNSKLYELRLPKIVECNGRKYELTVIPDVLFSDFIRGASEDAQAKNIPYTIDTLTLELVEGEPAEHQVIHFPQESGVYQDYDIQCGVYGLKMKDIKIGKEFTTLDNLVVMSKGQQISVSKGKGYLKPKKHPLGTDEFNGKVYELGKTLLSRLSASVDLMSTLEQIETADTRSAKAKASRQAMGKIFGMAFKKYK